MTMFQRRTSYALCIVPNLFQEALIGCATCASMCLVCPTELLMFGQWTQCLQRILVFDAG